MEAQTKAFSKVIVRTPCQNIINGITSQNLGLPNYEKALVQFAQYVKALESCGVEVTTLPPSEEFPDSVFIEDTAVVTENFAIISNPGAESRKGEVQTVRQLLSSIYPQEKMRQIQAPGTLDGGDIIQVGNHFFIGTSNRTNQEGAKQLISFLQEFGMDGSIVEQQKLLHLKCGISYLTNEVLIGLSDIVNMEHFQKYKKIEVKDED